MTDLNLFCLIDGEPVSRAFSVKIAPDLTVGHLRDLIKAEKPVGFRDVNANYLTAWHVSVPVTGDDKGLPITLNALVEKKELLPVTEISEVFDGGVPKKSINIIVQRPSPAAAPTYPSSGSRPSTLFSGIVGAHVKFISDTLFWRGSSMTVFLDSFVRGQAMLPTTSGDIHGLPRAWRRSIAKPMEERPNLLFLDLPDSSATGTASTSSASASLLNKMENSRSLLIPVFDVSGCGKTRAVLEVLSQRWGFYFNASGDDWGSDDMSTLQSVVKTHLKETRMYDTDARYINNSVARKVTFLLFASRLLILEYCLSVPDSSKTFTSARWTLLQACPHVLFEDIFSLLFTALLELQEYCEAHLMDFVRNLFNETKTRLLQHGGMPKAKSDTKLPVFLDEAQVFGDAFDGSFVSVSSDRPLLSPILQGFDFIGHGQLTLVTCGTGTSVDTIFWPKSSGPSLKHGFGSRFPYMGFQRWTDQRSIKAYISRIRGCLPDDDSRRALDERFPQAAIDMLLKKLSGRLHPIVVAIEAIIRGNEQGAWQAAINDVEDRLVSWEKRDVKGNLCFELSQVREKWVKNRSQFEDSFESILGLLLYRRCMFGDDKVEFVEAIPELVEHALARIKVVEYRENTVLDEPFVMKAIEEYFSAKDPYLKEEIQQLMQLSDSPLGHGITWEYLMVSIFSEIFKTRPLSEWPHAPPISEMCAALVGKVEIVGWKEPGSEQGALSPKHISMEEFMDAHVNRNSIRNNKAVAPFFFPKPKPSGPDMVFFIRIEERIIPVAVQLKLRQDFSKEDREDAVSTVSAEETDRHAKTFRDFCPEKIYVSMIVAYPAKWTSKLAPRPDIKFEGDDDLQQVVIHVEDSNFGQVFPGDHVKFIDRLKNLGERSVQD